MRFDTQYRRLTDPVFELFFSDEEAAALPRLPSSALPGAAPQDGGEEVMSEMDSDEARELMEADSDDDSVDLDLLGGGEDQESGDEGQPKQPVPVSTLKTRMASAVRALSDWKTFGSKIQRSRSDVMDQFIQDVCEYYGYNAFLAEKLIELFPIDEVRSKRLHLVYRPRS